MPPLSAQHLPSCFTKRQTRIIVVTHHRYSSRAGAGAPARNQKKRAPTAEEYARPPRPETGAAFVASRATAIRTAQTFCRQHASPQLSVRHYAPRRFMLVLVPERLLLRQTPTRHMPFIRLLAPPPIIALTHFHLVIASRQSALATPLFCRRLPAVLAS